MNGFVFKWLGNCDCDVWTKLGVSARFHLAIYAVFDVESDSAVRNCQIRQGNDEMDFRNLKRKLFNPFIGLHTLKL